MESMESVGGYFHSDQLSSLPSCASTEVGQRGHEHVSVACPEPSASIIPDSNTNELGPSTNTEEPPVKANSDHVDSAPPPTAPDANQSLDSEALIQQSTSWDLPPSSPVRPSPETSPDSRGQHSGPGPGPGPESELLRKFSEGRFPFKSHHSWQSMKSQSAEARLTTLPDEIDLAKSNELSQSNETKESQTASPSLGVGASLAVGTQSPPSSDVGGLPVDSSSSPFIVWPTGQRTRVCLLDTCRLAAASIEEVVQSSDSGVGQESNYATLLALLCPICKHRVVRDLLKVRKVIRQIIVLQTRFRWRLAHRRKVLERRNRMGGLDPNLYDQQALSTKGRCFRCIPLLQNLKERIAWRQKKEKPSSNSFRSDGSNGQTGIPSQSFHCEPSASFCRSGMGASSSLAVPEAEVSPSMVHESSMSSEQSLKPSQSQSANHQAMSSQSNHKGKEQFLREVHQLIFELCSRCQETARAELQILRNNRLSSLGKGKSSRSLVPPGAKTKR